MTTPVVGHAIKSNDRLPAIEGTLGFSNGAPADLTGATSVHFIMRERGASGPPKVRSLATIVAAGDGRVRYDWAAVDTDTPGVYDAEWQVTYSDGRARSFPTDSYLTVTVFADLDDA